MDTCAHSMLTSLCMTHSDDDAYEGGGMTTEEWYAYHGESTRDTHPEQL